VCGCDDGTCPTDSSGDCDDGNNCLTSGGGGGCDTCTCDDGTCGDSFGDCDDDSNCFGDDVHHRHAHLRNKSVRERRDLRPR